MAFLSMERTFPQNSAVSPRNSLIIRVSCCIRNQIKMKDQWPQPFLKPFLNSATEQKRKFTTFSFWEAHSIVLLFLMKNVARWEKTVVVAWN